ncbi:MAG: hypothetical protein RLZZ126_1435 [Pseudomonadota bacterium]|jgi:hypothetical protein
MKKILLTISVVLLSACTSIVKVEGEQVINQKMVIKLPQAWNKLANPSNQPYEVWTQEGVTLDQLRLWSGVASGAALANPVQRPASGKEPRKPVFTRGMPLDQIASQFEAVFAVDGSNVTMDKLDPVPFMGQKGLRFEFTVTRQSDGVILKGLGWAAEAKGQLHAVTYTAPRLSFFQRHADSVRALVATATLKG